MNEYTLKGGAIVKVAPLTYINKHRYTTMLRLGLNSLDKIVDDLGAKEALDKDAVLPILIDLIKVSAMATTDHPITGWLLDYTSDEKTLIDGFSEFLSALINPEFSQVFEQMVGFVNRYLNEQEAKAPTQPTDPN